MACTKILTKVVTYSTVYKLSVLSNEKYSQRPFESLVFQSSKYTDSRARLPGRPSLFRDKESQTESMRTPRLSSYADQNRSCSFGFHYHLALLLKGNKHDNGNQALNDFESCRAFVDDDWTSKQQSQKRKKMPNPVKERKFVLEASARGKR